MSGTRTVVLAGASGFIGRYFRARFEKDGWSVRTIGRKGAKGSPSATWDDDDARLARVLDGAELLVNLAGRSVSLPLQRPEQGRHTGVPRFHYSGTRPCRRTVPAAAVDLAQCEHRHHLPPCHGWPANRT